MRLPNPAIGTDTGSALRALQIEPESAELLEHGAEMLAALVKVALRLNAGSGRIAGVAMLHRAAEILRDEPCRADDIDAA